MAAGYLMFKPESTRKTWASNSSQRTPISPSLEKCTTSARKRPELPRPIPLIRPSKVSPVRKGGSMGGSSGGNRQPPSDQFRVRILRPENWTVPTALAKSDQLLGVPALARYFPAHVIRGELFTELSRFAEADACLEAAALLASDGPSRRYVRRRRAELPLH